MEAAYFSASSVLADLMAPAAKAFWDEQMRQMPCVFGRLSLLASLRDSNQAVYQTPELVNRFGPDATNRALRATHLQVFWEWLEFSLEEKRADLELYLSLLPDSKRLVVSSWLQLRPYRMHVPHYATEAEVDIYLSELETLLELLRAELDLPPSR